jgi:uncharacterized protein YggE
MKILPILALAALLASPALSLADENERTLTVRASAEHAAAPDIVIITVAVETMAAGAKESASLNAAASGDVIKAATASMGAHDSVETSSFSVFPVYDYDKGRREILRGFRTVNQIKFTSSVISSAGGILDAAIKAGANRVVEVRFDVKDVTPVCEGLIKTAAVRAAAQAKAASNAFATALGEVKTIVPSCAREMEGPVRLYAAEMKAAATPIEPGMVRLRADVEAVYFLGKGL